MVADRRARGREDEGRNGEIHAGQPGEEEVVGEGRIGKIRSPDDLKSNGDLHEL